MRITLEMSYISRNVCAVVDRISSKIFPNFYFKQMQNLEGRNKNSVCTALPLISIFEVIRTLFRHNLAQDLFIKCFSIHLPVSYMCAEASEPVIRYILSYKIRQILLRLSYLTICACTCFRYQRNMSCTRTSFFLSRA